MKGRGMTDGLLLIRWAGVRPGNIGPPPHCSHTTARTQRFQATRRQRSLTGLLSFSHRRRKWRDGEIFLCGSEEKRRHFLDENIIKKHNNHTRDNRSMKCSFIYYFYIERRKKTSQTRTGLLVLDFGTITHALSPREAKNKLLHHLETASDTDKLHSCSEFHHRPDAERLLHVPLTLQLPPVAPLYMSCLASRLAAIGAARPRLLENDGKLRRRRSAQRGPPGQRAPVIDPQSSAAASLRIAAMNREVTHLRTSGPPLRLIHGDPRLNQPRTET